MYEETWLVCITMLAARGTKFSQRKCG